MVEFEGIQCIFRFHGIPDFQTRPRFSSKTDVMFLPRASRWGAGEVMDKYLRQAFGFEACLTTIVGHVWFLEFYLSVLP